MTPHLFRQIRQGIALASRIEHRLGRFARLAGGLPAGVVDAAFASLATFAAGLAAVNLLSDTDRGVYAVFIAAFIVANTFPHNLVYLPSQVYAVGRPKGERLSYLARTSVIGVGFSFLGSIAILAAAVATASHTSLSVTIALTFTAVLNLTVSAAQDNLRRMLHITDLHWSAASMSVIQFGSVAVALLTMLFAGVPVVWMPFGSLISANIISTTFGLMRAGGLGRWKAPTRLQPRTLVNSGRWLLAQALIPTGAAFLAATVITTLAGAAAMGYAESARVVAQPVLVFATGLTAVLGPRVMGAAMLRENEAARSMLRRFAQLTFGAGILYLVVAGWATPWNPMQYLVPSAYVVTGLVAVTILANVAFGSLFLLPEELMGARREADLVKVSLIESPLLIGIAFTASLTGAFARPFGILVQSVGRLIPFIYYRTKVYRGE